MKKAPSSSVVPAPDSDLQIDVANLQKEFRNFPSTRYSYAESKAESEYNYDLAKQSLKELRAQKYIAQKSAGQKITETHLEAVLDDDAEVKAATKAMLDAKRDMHTLEEFTKSLDSKKDMLIQLGADARKEV